MDAAKVRAEALEEAARIAESFDYSAAEGYALAARIRALIPAAPREPQEEALAARASSEVDAEWLEACAPGYDTATHDHDGWLWCGNCDTPLWVSTDPRDTPADTCSCEWSAKLRALQTRARTPSVQPAAGSRGVKEET